MSFGDRPWMAVIACRQIRVLRVPADQLDPCTVLLLPDRAVDFSAAIGGECMDEEHLDCAGDSYCLDLPDQREHLPVNTRLVALVEALGWIDHQSVGLRGDAVLSGLLPSGNDIDVPEVAIGEAQRLGQLEPDAVCPSMPVRLVGELAPPLPGRRSSRRRPQ